MRAFLRRINKLIRKIKPLAQNVLTLFYVDGTKRVMMDSEQVFFEIMSGRVESFQYKDDDGGEDGFYAALMDGCHDIHELFKDGDDSWMLENVEKS